MRVFLFVVAAGIAAAQNVQTLPPLDQLHRLKWAAVSAIGPPNLAAGMVTSAISTWTNNPHEYGPHWEGWAKRQGLRASGSAVSNLMEAEIGALWGEDPRYHRAQTRKFKGRLANILQSGYTAYNREGKLMPAYARFIAIPSSNLISNAWRPDSQHGAGQVTSRIAIGFASRLGSNAFFEFWPDIKKHVFHME